MISLGTTRWAAKNRSWAGPGLVRAVQQ
uniref:Uncharacterized protein n=1 Tax=Arundo donax TaxID=35708 RepID=A0A0A8Z5Q8_ARUDO